MSRHDRALRGTHVMFALPSLGLGGAERQAFLLARHLATAEGAHVRLVAFNVTGPLAGEAERLGIRAEMFPLRHAFRSRAGHVRDLLRFASFVRRAKVDVLLPYCMFQNVLCGLAWRLTRVRTCIWNQRDEGRSRLEPWIEKIAVRSTPRFISNSTHGARFLTDVLCARPDRVHLVRNGVELAPPHRARDAWRSSLAIPPDAFFACMVANLHGYKDHATLVAAWRIVCDAARRTGSQAHLALAGAWGDRYESLRRQVDDLGLGARVHFLGSVEDVAGLLAASDAAVFSSSAEGIPNAVLEAMAAGLPVVATDYPGIREALGPDLASGLVPAADADALAGAVLQLRASPETRSALGRCGQRRVADHFGVEAMCRATVGIIQAELK